MAEPAPETRVRAPALDAPLVLLALSIVLFGLIMVTSASITIAGRDGAPFAFLERQLLLVLIGLLAAALPSAYRRRRLEQAAMPLLLLALLLLALLLVPGLGPSGERQPALAASRGPEFSGVRGRTRAGADLHRELRRALRRGIA